MSCRYVRSYITEAAEREGEPLSGLEVEALDCFEEIAHRDGVPISFVLEPGEAVLINNLTVMHARTAFRSDEHPERKRLLLRLWMMAHESRPQRPELKIFDGEGEHGIPPQAGRTPSYVSASADPGDLRHRALRAVTGNRTLGLVDERRATSAPRALPPRRPRAPCPRCRCPR